MKEQIFFIRPFRNSPYWVFLLKKFAVVVCSAGPGPAFIEFFSLTYQSVDFLIYQGETIPGTGLPYRDIFVYTLLQSGNKPIPQTMYTCGSMTRLCEL